MAAPAVTNTFVSGATARASEVNQNFTDVINGITDGTKDLSVNKVTCATDFVTPKMTGTTKVVGKIGIRSVAMTSAPDTLLHLQNGEVTGVSANASALLTLEADTSGGGSGLNILQFLSDSTTSSCIYFGVGTDNDHGKIVYDENGNLIITQATSDRLAISAAGLVVIKPAGGAEAYLASATYSLDVQDGQINVKGVAGNAPYFCTLGAVDDNVMYIQGGNSAGAIACSTTNSDASMYVYYAGAQYKIPLYS